jgi:hypothetical protein
MRTRSKLLLAALMAAVFMSLAVSAASARRFELSNQRYLAIWPLLTFEAPGTATIRCPVTLEGSFHSRTLSKVSGQLIGYVTSAKVRGAVNSDCNNDGTARVNTETLPWHMRYLSFIGGLPNISGITIQLVGADFNVKPNNIFLPNCRVRTTAREPGVGIAEIAAGGVARTLRADETRGITPTGICELGGATDFRGIAEVFLQASLTTRITIRLVQ